MTDRDSGLPRSHFLILLSLADTDRHGLGIVEDVELRTGGSVRLGPGTLYTALKRLVADDRIAEVATPPDPADHDTRRKYYTLTPVGRAALIEEAELMRDLVRALDEKSVAPDTGGAG